MGRGHKLHSRAVLECRAACGNPPDLSISIRGGKENNGDSISSGERSWSSPDGKARKAVVTQGAHALEGASAEGDRPVAVAQRGSSAVWECSVNGWLYAPKAKYDR